MRTALNEEEKLDNESLPSTEGDSSPPTKRLSLKYPHLIKRSPPRGHLRVDQALDLIGKSEFDDWGTQFGFSQLPIIRRNRKRYRVYIGTNGNGAARIVRKRLPLEFRTPEIKHCVSQFQAAKSILRDGLESGHVKAIFESSKDNLTEVPKLRWSKYPISTLACGETKDAAGFFRKIFIDKQTLSDFLRYRREPTDEQPAPRSISETTLKRIGEAIKTVSDREQCLPKRADLTAWIQEIIRRHRNMSLSGPQLVQLRKSLPDHAKRGGRRIKRALDRAVELRPAFCSAIEAAIGVRNDVFN